MQFALGGITLGHTRRCFNLCRMSEDRSSSYVGCRQRLAINFLALLFPDACRLEDYEGTAAGCKAAAESAGYDFTATANGGHAVPVAEAA